jgi:hypothetical protein
MRWVGFAIATVLAAGRLAAAPPETRPLRLGIAGLSHSHVHGILGRAGADVRIVGIAEPNRELAARYAKRYGVDAGLLFASLEEMLAGEAGSRGGVRPPTSTAPSSRPALHAASTSWWRSRSRSTAARLSPCRPSPSATASTS